MLFDLPFVVPQPIYLVLGFFLLCLQFEDFISGIRQQFSLRLKKGLYRLSTFGMTLDELYT
jgi:hypothetical protein